VAPVVLALVLGGCARDARVASKGDASDERPLTTTTVPTLDTARWVDPTDGADGWSQGGPDRPPHASVQLKERWRVDGTGPLFGSPVLVDGVLYVVSSSGARAVEAATGATRWENADVTSFAGFSFDDGALYAVSGTADRVVKVEPEDGRIVWTTQLPAQADAATFAPPRVVGDVVLVGESSTESLTTGDGLDFRGRMYGLDAGSGTIRWQHWTTEEPHSGASVWTFPTVDVDAGVVYFGTSNNYTDPPSDSSDSVFALDVATGEKRWSRQLLAGDVWAFQTHGPNGEFDYDVSTSPVLVDGRGDERDLLVVAQKNGKVSALDRSDGELVWQRQVSDGGRQGGVLGSLAFDGSHLLVVGNNGTSNGPGSEEANGEEVVPRLFWPPDAVSTSVLVALDPSSGEMRWSRQLGAWSLSAVSVVDGVGYVAVGKGVEVFDPVMGATFDRVALPVETSSVVMGGGGVVFVGVSGGWNANGDALVAFDVIEG